MPASWIRYRLIGFNHGRVEHNPTSIHRALVFLSPSLGSQPTSQQLHTSNVTSCRIAPCMLRLCACSFLPPPPVREESIAGLSVGVLVVMNNWTVSKTLVSLLMMFRPLVVGED